METLCYRELHKQSFKRALEVALRQTRLVGSFSMLQVSHIDLRTNFSAGVVFTGCQGQAYFIPLSSRTRNN